MCANRLQLNVPKTACMASPPTIAVTIQTAGQPVVSTPSIKVLSITFTSNLKWETNAKLILVQLAYRLSVLRTIRTIADFPTMRKIAGALIVSKVSYSLPAWGNLPQYLQQRFQSVLLTAACICLGYRHQRSSTSQLLSLMHWQSYPQMVETQTSKLLHQVLITNQPQILLSKLPGPAAGGTHGAARACLRIGGGRYLNRPFHTKDSNHIIN